MKQKLYTLSGSHGSIIVDEHGLVKEIISETNKHSNHYDSMIAVDWEEYMEYYGVDEPKDDDILCVRIFSNNKWHDVDKDYRDETNKTTVSFTKSELSEILFVFEEGYVESDNSEGIVKTINDTLHPLKEYVWDNSTVSLWFDGDNGTVMARNDEDALAMAKQQYVSNVKHINELLDGRYVFAYDLDDFAISEGV